jgi:hypothetical protein
MKTLKRYLRIAFAAVLFGEHREVGLWFWVGIGLIILSVLIQSRISLQQAGKSVN